MEKPNDKCETPPKLFQWLDRRYKFELDAAATADNTKCPRFFEDALNTTHWGEWAASIFCNPPYSKTQQWIAKCWLEASHDDCTIAVLIPPPNGGRYWHDYVFGKASKVIFIAGRVAFLDPETKHPIEGTNRYGSCVVVYEKGKVNRGLTEIESVLLSDIMNVQS